MSWPTPLPRSKPSATAAARATTNARISPDGYVVTEGDQVFLGGNDSYIAMCHKCYQDYINEHRKVELLHGTERDPQ